MESEKKIQISIFFIIALLNVVLNWFHLLYAADRIEKTIGVVLSYFLPPVIYFTILYGIAVAFSPIMRNLRYSKVWFLIVIAVACGYIPLCVLIYGMQFGNG